jgi:hypothetical protein
VHEFRQPYMRGGAHERLPDAELGEKFKANLRFGGLTDGAIQSLQGALDRIATGGSVELSPARQ